MPFTNNYILLIVIIIVILLFIYCIKIFDFFDPAVNNVEISVYNSNINEINKLVSSLSSDVSVLSNNLTSTSNSDVTGKALRDLNDISNYINTNAANYLDYKEVGKKYGDIVIKINDLVTSNNRQQVNFTTVS